MALPTTPHSGKGIKLQRGVGDSPETFVDVVGIKTLSGPNISRETYDTTDMNTPNNFRTFAAGLVDAGELSITGNWIPGDPSMNQEEGGLLAEFDTGFCDTPGSWRLTYPDCDGQTAGYLEFDGILTAMNMDHSFDALMTFTGTLKISGKPTLVTESD